MRILENHFIKNFAGIKFCSCLLLMLLVFGCTKVESPLIMPDDSSDAILKSKTVINEPINFEGTSEFDVYAVKEHRVIASGDEMFLLLTATLTPLGGQDYLFETEEVLPPPVGPFLYRKISFEVKISPGGAVMFSWPETWWELGTVRGDVIGQLLAHTGCIVYGPGINKGTLNYKGHFDGTNFSVKTHFMGKQINPEPAMTDYWNIDGPAQFEFSFELMKVD